MLRKNSTQALPRRTAHGLLGKVRTVPITAPTTNANNSDNNDTDTVQPQADIIQSK